MRSVSDRIRRDLRILHEADRSLHESTAYDAMFQDLRAAGPASTMAEIASIIASARRALVRNDRVVWFLRQWKIGKLLASVGGREDAPAPDDTGMRERTAALLAGALDAYCARAGIGVAAATRACASLYTAPRVILDRLAHYLSLPVPAIQEVVFGFQTLETLIASLKDAEKRWQDKARDSLPVDPGDRLLLDCGGGYGWYDLGRASCGAEGLAMGHCGNVPRESTDDTLLSLRKLEAADGGEVRARPYVTFVLGSDGFLGEMKGRFNRSPAEAARDGSAPSDFAREIARLLRLPMIHGLRGGGFEAEHNFKLADLPASLRDALVDEKPEVASVATLIDRRGETAAVGGHIEALFAEGERNYRPVLRRGGRDFVMEHYHSLGSVALDLTAGRGRSQAALAFEAWESGREPNGRSFAITAARVASFLEGLREDGGGAFRVIGERVARVLPHDSGTADVPLMAQAMVSDEDLEPLLGTIAHLIARGRRDYLREFAENYLLDWYEALRPVSNSQGVTLACAVHDVTPRLGFASEVLVTAPFATLAVIADRGWMDRNLGEVIAFDDGPAFQPDQARWSVEVAVEAGRDRMW